MRNFVMPHRLFSHFFATLIFLIPAVVKAQELNFDAPVVEEKKGISVPQNLGPASNIQLGGAIDWRASFQNGSDRPFAFIHVNEFVVSANVGDHIAISAEQLLLTSELGTVVGQDHGFVVVNLIQLPFLPNGMNLKLGRFRGKFGSDALTDSPANIFPSPALRSNGYVTDIGFGIDYPFGDFELLLEAFNGPDYKIENGKKNSYLAKNIPVQGRFIYQPASNLKFGFSGMRGETYDNQLSPTLMDLGALGARFDTSRTIERWRVSGDAQLKTSFADIVVEGIYGRDHGRLAQPVDKTYTEARGGLVRTDIPLFSLGANTRAKWSLQYDTWKDGSYPGTLGFISTAFSLLNDDGWTVRLGGTASDIVFKKDKPRYVDKNPVSVTSQLLVSF